MEHTYPAVHDPLVALLADIQLDVGGVGRSDSRLSHKERRADLAFHQGLQPLSLLLLVAILGNDLHVTRVGGGAVCGLGGNLGSAEPLSHEAVLYVGEAGRLLVVSSGEEHVPEAELAGLVLEILDDLGVGIPSGIAMAELGINDGVGTVMLGSCQYRKFLGSLDGSCEKCLRNAVLLDELGDDIDVLASLVADKGRNLDRTCGLAWSSVDKESLV